MAHGNKPIQVVLLHGQLPDKKMCWIWSYFAIADLKFGEMVVSDGVSVQTTPTAPHSFSRPAETCHRDEERSHVAFNNICNLMPVIQLRQKQHWLDASGIGHRQMSYSVQAISGKGFLSQSQDLRLGIVITSQLVCWTDIFESSMMFSPLKPITTSTFRYKTCLSMHELQLQIPDINCAHFHRTIGGL